jgi:predicted nucleic acid-binding protein
MKVLVDTNVLLRCIQKSHPACRVARQALVSLLRGDHSLHLAPQNISEFWNVCTRPVDVNGLGLSIEGTSRYTDQLLRLFTLLPDSHQVFLTWRDLVVEYSVMGAKVHDARLVAIMKTHDIARIITFNVGDFSRFAGIEAIHPQDIAN